WTGNRMLALCGILYAGVFSQGPHGYQLKGEVAAKIKAMHPEKREAVEETFNLDLHNAIEFISHLTFKVIDNEYEQELGREIMAALYEEEGKKKVRPVKGFKGAPDLL